MMSKLKMLIEQGGEVPRTMSIQGFSGKCLAKGTADNVQVEIFLCVCVCVCVCVWWYHGHCLSKGSMDNVRATDNVNVPT